LAYFLIDAERSVQARIDAVADTVARTLELQQRKIQWVNNQRSCGVGHDAGPRVSRTAKSSNVKSSNVSAAAL
jgi:hypothetical protein